MSEGICLSSIHLFKRILSDLNNVITVVFLCDVVMDDARGQQNSIHTRITPAMPLWVGRSTVWAERNLSR